MNASAVSVSPASIDSGESPNKVTTALKVALMATVLAVLTTPTMYLLVTTPERPIDIERWILLIISAIANVGVIVYHYVIPPHPKFLMLPLRRLTLRTHITSGTIELVASIVAIFGHSPRAAIIQACAALFFHVPSAALQTPIVFGSQAIMHSSYVLCIALHAVCASMLLTHPESLTWSVNTFLIFNIYVWCRVYFYIFDWSKLFSGMKYTISILAAGVTIVPAVLGPTGVLAWSGFVGVYILLYRYLFLTSPEQYLDFVHEKARDSTSERAMEDLASMSEDPLEQEREAKSVFDSLDEDHGGSLTRDEIAPVLASWSLPAQVVDSLIVKASDDKGHITFPAFVEHMWSLRGIRNRASRLLQLREIRSEMDKARFVFDQVDLDGGGSIGPDELMLLLHEWGLPHHEAGRYIARVDKNGNGEIDFEEFFEHMRPIWRFIYYDVYQAQDVRNPEMVGRSVAAMKERRRVSAMRKRIVKELVPKVSYLSGASEKLISDLSESLVTEEFAAGAKIFGEGDTDGKFFFLETGSVRLSRNSATIAELHAGDCIGEGAVTSDKAHSMTATAIDAVSLFALSRQSFRLIADESPRFRDELLAIHRSRSAKSG